MRMVAESGRETASPAAQARVAGDCGILIVEQERRVGASIKSTLEQAGYRVIGPAVTVPQALACLEQAEPDAAILDLDLSGSLSAPVARALRRRGVPFLLLTNHPCPGFLDAAYERAPRLERPLRRNELVRSLQRLISAAAARRRQPPLRAAS